MSREFRAAWSGQQDSNLPQALDSAGGDSDHRPRTPVKGGLNGPAILTVVSPGKGRKPTLGYPSRTRAVLALRGEGLSINEVAARIGIEAKAVSALELSGRRSRQVAASNRTVLFSVELLHQLRLHAERRRISENELARRIVEAVIDDGLVDAVLDDGDKDEGR